MDCVGCNKCQLWGKVQTTGLATALKILFEMDEKALEWVNIPFFGTIDRFRFSALPPTQISSQDQKLSRS